MQERPLRFVVAAFSLQHRNAALLFSVPVVADIFPVLADVFPVLSSILAVIMKVFLVAADVAIVRAKIFPVLVYVFLVFADARSVLGGIGLIAFFYVFPQVAAVLGKILAVLVQIDPVLAHILLVALQITLAVVALRPGAGGQQTCQCKSDQALSGNLFHAHG